MFAVAETRKNLIIYQKDFQIAEEHEMIELIKSLAATPVSTILVIGGIFFLFLSIGGQFGAKIVTDSIKPKSAVIVGAILLIAGVAIYWLGERVPGETSNQERDLSARIQGIEQELQRIERQQQETRQAMHGLQPQIKTDPNAQQIWQEHEQQLQELERHKQELEKELERLHRLRK